MAVRDLVIDENEAEVIRTIYRLLMEEGYGTNRVAQYLNDKGILTKKGTSLWRGTTIRAIIENPIYNPIPLVPTFISRFLRSGLLRFFAFWHGL